MNRRSLFRTLVAAPLAAVAAKVGLVKDVVPTENVGRFTVIGNLNESESAWYMLAQKTNELKQAQADWYSSLVFGKPQKFTGKFIREK